MSKKTNNEKTLTLNDFLKGKNHKQLKKMLRRETVVEKLNRMTRLADNEEKINQ